MIEMIERVTWAVCPILRAADECDMPQIINGPRPECRKCPPTEAHGGTAGCRIVADLVARAAIEAHEAALAETGFVIVPREPTGEMKDAGALTLMKPDGVTPNLDGQPSESWRAMIDAALISERGAKE